MSKFVTLKPAEFFLVPELHPFSFHCHIIICLLTVTWMSTKVAIPETLLQKLLSIRVASQTIFVGTATFCHRTLKYIYSQPFYLRRVYFSHPYQFIFFFIRLYREDIMDPDRNWCFHAVDVINVLIFFLTVFHFFIIFRNM